jgi:hypothetical protein
MSKPTVYGIFASALGAGYTDAEAAGVPHQRGDREGEPPGRHSARQHAHELDARAVA